MASSSWPYHIPFLWLSLFTCFHVGAGSRLQVIGGDPSSSGNSPSASRPAAAPLPWIDDINNTRPTREPASPGPLLSPEPARAAPAPTFADTLNRSPTPSPTSAGQPELSAFRKRGKIVGIVLFTIAVVLQAVIALFLIRKRRQMLKHMRRFQDHRDRPRQWPDT